MITDGQTYRQVFSTRLILLQRVIANSDSVYLLSVCPSVRWTRAKLLYDSRYRNNLAAHDRAASLVSCSMPNFMLGFPLDSTVGYALTLPNRFAFPTLDVKQAIQYLYYDHTRKYKPFWRRYRRQLMLLPAATCNCNSPMSKTFTVPTISKCTSWQKSVSLRPRRHLSHINSLKFPQSVCKICFNKRLSYHNWPDFDLWPLDFKI